MDEHFALFLEEFGSPTARQEVPVERMVKYAGVLPECLLSYWQSHGWASFQFGLISLTDPDIYSDLILNWLSKVKNLRGSDYVVFARTGFGDLYAYHPSTGNIISVCTTAGWIMAPKKHDTPVKNRELRMQSFFATALPSDFDIRNDLDEPIFNSLVASLGPLQSDEIYRFCLDPNDDSKLPLKQSLHEYLGSVASSDIPVLRLV